MSDEIAYYTFLPWLRQGIANQINVTSGSESNIVIPITLKVKAHKKDGDLYEEMNDIVQNIILYGPGEVTGIDQRIIIRTDPKPNVGDFEPNFFPAIEFTEPDFPWRFTPLKAIVQKPEKQMGGMYVEPVPQKISPGIDEQNVKSAKSDLVTQKAAQNRSSLSQSSILNTSPVNISVVPSVQQQIQQPKVTLPKPEENAISGRLLPWLCLIVLKSEEFKRNDVNPNNPLPILTIKKPASCLPDLSQSWAWAHVQVYDEISETNLDEQKSKVRNQWDEQPRKLVSRIVCPRKLEPGVAYTAFLVPTFKLGCMAGLGETIKVTSELRFSWDFSKNPEAELYLPVYYSWNFRTGLRGDFEYLVRILKPLIIDDNEGKIGKRKMDISDPGLAVAPVDHNEEVNQAENQTEESLRHVLDLEGALVATNFLPSKWKIPNSFQKDLMNLLNLPQSLITTPDQVKTNLDGFTLIVTPPVYGCWHAAQLTVSSALVKDYGNIINRGWLSQLNLDARHRTVAAFGTGVIQNQQEDLMASAWEQVGAIEEANQLLRQAQLARLVSTKIFNKHLTCLNHDGLLSITCPVYKKILNQNITIYKSILNSKIPASILSSAFRRVAGPGGIPRRHPQTHRFTISHQFIQRINNNEMFNVPKDVSNVPASGISQPIGYGKTFTTSKVSSQQPFIIKPLKNTVNMNANEQAPSIQQVRQRVFFNASFFTAEKIKNTPPRPDFQVFKNAAKQSQPLAGIGNQDSNDAAQFRKAAIEMLEYINRPPVKVTPPNAIKLADIRKTILERLTPEYTIPARIQGRFNFDLTEKRSDPLDVIMAAPKFPQPMYVPLRDLSSDYLLPGVEFIPPDTISLLNTNQRFVEAFMVGLNHEMGRELLWREYPTDQRGSYFRQFWDVRGSITTNKNGGIVSYDESDEEFMDIQPVHLWKPDNNIGENKRGQNKFLVLLVRGELLKKYPNTIIYATPAEDNNGSRTFNPEAKDLFPIFRGTIPPDITFFGFAGLTAEQAKGINNEPGYYFVIQEQPAEPRFGLDILTTESTDIPVLTKWRDLTWAHVKLNNCTNYIDLTKEKQPSLSKLDDNDESGETLRDKNRQWNSHSADMAYITLQRPVRIAVHASQMLPANI